MLELREDDPSGPAARRLWDEYIVDVRHRLGESFVPTEEIFGEDEAFTVPGAVWLTAYEDGRPVACAGLRPLAPGLGEIKRMFVTPVARSRGHGRRLLEELERRAAAGGMRRIRLITTEALHEARALYASVGYRVVEVRAIDGRLDFGLEREMGVSGPAPRPAGGPSARRPG